VVSATKLLTLFTSEFFFCFQAVAERRQSIQDSLETSAIASCKKVDEHTEEIEKKQRKAKPKQDQLDTAKVTVVKVEEMIKKHKIKMAKEVEDILETVQAKEFGPGESPLRELARIGSVTNPLNSVLKVSFDNKFEIIV